MRWEGMAKNKVGKHNDETLMRRLPILVIVGALVLAGCSDDDEGPRQILARTLSDQAADGDIGFSASPPPDGTYTISQADATGSLLFGIDSEGTEFRAFLDFPLDGSNGGEPVPLWAEIVSADIKVLVNNVELASAVPTLLDLVPFPITGLTPTDFDSLPLATLGPFDFFRSDIQNFVRIDVTPLMEETQAKGLRDLQLRLLLDFVPEAAGWVRLEDGEDSTAPLLTVEYRL
jgi:hypothetical protein